MPMYAPNEYDNALYQTFYYDPNKSEGKKIKTIFFFFF